MAGHQEIARLAGMVHPRLRNLTPHDVVVRWPGGERRLPSEGIARVDDQAQPGEPVCGLPVVDVHPGAALDLPDPEPGVTLLVSRVMALAVPERRDLVFPFGEIRDDGGQIVAVSSLARWSPNYR